jgi:predicted nucleic acid-binding protein
VIAVDTSSLISFFEGEKGIDIDLVEAGFHASALFLPPPVLTELLSDPALPDEVSNIIRQFPLLAILDGFWERAGQLRAKVLAKGRKARVADALIAQLAIDHNILLVTRNTDFKGFALVSKLKIMH